jgi:branched-chain amino acid transport system permease protein
LPKVHHANSQGRNGRHLPDLSLFMDLALQLLFTGIGIGAVYALVALGFVLIFRATNVVNFAQGEFSMVAAYLMVVFAVDLGWPYWLSFLLALAGMALLGAIFNLGVYYPLRHRTFLPVIIATIGASILMANSVLAIYGPQPQVLEGWFETPGIQLGPVYLDSQYLLIIAVTIVLVIFNYWFFEHTMLGKKLQATSQDKEMASLLGISVSTMIMITFIYSAVLGGLAGILVAPVLFVSIQMGSTIALKAFAATIIGGFGDVAGAIIGGLALGIIETFGAAYISVPYKDGFAFLVLVLFLVFRPQGIFGERVAEKA